LLKLQKQSRHQKPPAKRINFHVFLLFWSVTYPNVACPKEFVYIPVKSFAQRLLPIRSIRECLYRAWNLKRKSREEKQSKDGTGGRRTFTHMRNVLCLTYHKPKSKVIAVN
jgi:hypothetical protein